VGHGEEAGEAAGVGALADAGAAEEDPLHVPVLRRPPPPALRPREPRHAPRARGRGNAGGRRGRRAEETLYGRHGRRAALQAGGVLGFGLGERFLHLRSICTRGGFGTGKARRRRRRRWWASEQRRGKTPPVGVRCSVHRVRTPFSTRTISALPLSIGLVGPSCQWEVAVCIQA
jgi:hypothetical protein